MWVIPTRVNPIPDLSRYLDAFRMSRQRAGNAVRRPAHSFDDARPDVTITG